jgi:hypothetical protein
VQTLPCALTVIEDVSPHEKYKNGESYCSSSMFIMSISIVPSIDAHSMLILSNGLITKVPPSSIRSSKVCSLEQIFNAVHYLLSKLSASSYLTRAPSGIIRSCCIGQRSVNSHEYSVAAQQKKLPPSAHVAVLLLDTSNRSGSWIQPENELLDTRLANVSSINWTNSCGMKRLTRHASSAGFLDLELHR